MGETLIMLTVCCLSMEYQFHKMPQPLFQLTPAPISQMILVNFQLKPSLRIIDTRPLNDSEILTLNHGL